MIEAPEALFLSEQLRGLLRGREITDLIPSHDPHKFTFYCGNPDTYIDLLTGKTITDVYARGGLIIISLSAGVYLAFTDGINLRYLEPGDKLPKKFQFLMGFKDQSCLIASTRMYGGILAFTDEGSDLPIYQYYLAAHDKPQVMSDAFSEKYFLELIDAESHQKKSAKAFLATDQTIPGLGNGVLQDILFNACIHPKTKIGELSRKQKTALFGSIKETLHRMYELKGRNTETDLFGTPGKYIPVLSSKTAGKPCPVCGETIRKEAYLGGSIYYCPHCQK